MVESLVFGMLVLSLIDNVYERLIDIGSDTWMDPLDVMLIMSGLQERRIRKKLQIDQEAFGPLSLLIGSIGAGRGALSLLGWSLLRYPPCQAVYEMGKVESVLR